MKHLTKAALLIGGTILASQSAFAQFVQNDLYMGFQNQAGGGSADYIINLGVASNIVGQSSVVDLSSDFSSSLFNNVALQGSSAQIYGGVVGGEAHTAGGGTSDIFVTQLRTGNIGNPAVAGSSLTASAPRSQDDSAESTLSQLSAPAAGTGLLDSGKSWENYVEPANSVSTFLGVTGLNPDSFVSSSTVLYEDLYETKATGVSGSGNYTYLGYFTLDLTGGSPKLTFTSTNVPASLTSPIIVSIKKAGTTVTVVSSNAVATFNYQLQYTTSLHPTNWINAGSAVIAGGVLVTNSDATASDPQRFYRVQGH